MRINEDVIRLLTVRVEEHEEGPSAMLRKREDSDRDDRGERGERRGGGGGRFDRERSGGGGDRGGRFSGRPPAAATQPVGEA